VRAFASCSGAQKNGAPGQHGERRWDYNRLGKRLVDSRKLCIHRERVQLSGRKSVREALATTDFYLPRHRLTLMRGFPTRAVTYIICFLSSSRPRLQTISMLTQWFVRIKYKYKLGWDYTACRILPAFTSRKAAEDYAKGLFAVEKWEIKEIAMTEKEARKSEIIRQFCAGYESDAEKGLQKPN
jgi:hypothetical protein